MVARHDEYYFEDGNVVFQVSGSTMTVLGPVVSDDRVAKGWRNALQDS